MLKLYDSASSGNCYKVRLLLAQLGRPVERIPVDVLAPVPAEVARHNPSGRVPLLVLDDGRPLAESNAILWYLADGSSYLAADAYSRARTLQWLFYEQYEHEPYVAVARFIRRWLPPDHPRTAELPRLVREGHDALGALDRALDGHDFLVDDRYSIADIALYAYTHCAADGGFDLAGYPSLRAWLGRVAAQPGHLPLDA